MSEAGGEPRIDRGFVRTRVAASRTESRSSPRPVRSFRARAQGATIESGHTGFDMEPVAPSIGPEA